MPMTFPKAQRCFVDGKLPSNEMCEDWQMLGKDNEQGCFCIWKDPISISEEPKRSCPWRHQVRASLNQCLA